MSGAQVTIAFAAGLVATVNPCGFAMLPAYLSYFLGLEEDGAPAGSTAGAVLRAVGVGMAVTGGFLTVFAVMGVLWGSVSSWLAELLPWVTLGIGVAIAGLGVAMLRGFEPTLNLPKPGRGATSRQAASMYLFGVSYAVASLSCTIGIFTSVVSASMPGHDIVDTATLFVIYGLGMGATLTVLTLAVALARQGVVRAMRHAVPHVNRVAGVLLVLAGAYLTYYGWWELQVLGGDLDPPGPADAVNGVRDDLQQWIADVGALRLGLVFGIVVGIAVAAALLAYHRRPVADLSGVRAGAGRGDGSGESGSDSRSGSDRR